MALTKERIEAGKKAIGGSEIPIVCGFSTFQSIQDLWQQKLGLVEPQQTTPAMERGLFLEDGIIRWSAHRTGLDLKPNKVTVKKKGKMVEEQRTMYSNRHQLCMATPDGGIWEKEGKVNVMKGTVQVKSPGLKMMGDWADPEEIPDGIPLYVLPQIMWEMEAAQCREMPALVSALVGGDIRIYRIRFNEEMVKLLFKQAEEFMGYVSRKEPPPHDGSARSADWIKEHYKQKDAGMVKVSGAQELELLRLATNFKNAQEEIKKLEAQKNDARAKMQDFLKERAGMKGNGWRATWKEDKQGRVSYRKAAEDLGYTDEMEEKYRGAPVRRFLVNLNVKGE